MIALKYLLIELTYLMLWPSFFSFALKLFRFPLKAFIVQIAFSSILLSQLSTLIQSTKLAYFMSILHCLGTMLAMWLIFRVRLMYSIIMVLLADLVFSVTEYAINIINPSGYITFVTEDNMFHFFVSGIPFIIAVNLITVAMSCFRLGFTFISRSGQTKRLQFVGSTVVKITIFAGMLMLAISSLLYYFIPKILLAFALALFIVLAILLRKSYRWEMEEMKE
ncbi:hypothetical protein SD70_31270 [Gordoniibacillus kamchatkensis]|uniref:Uncharacterized protein n=1 Tax=Gordoniibacillus kamchatkensis TaxID=1590651 RepID=A0ABR5A711_9BACL|nr:hypothetical protein [Paenibacillus sp. VKM B-2647]KIL36808.1 hypothetical protein SD70_31270 [Paenibacillus sp. VKM B-2647]